ncbi:hypothetical protein BS17DRAFT_837722 [Gyrodon lividus]|nr:hypothetical protein BS17DRAFT_837722 [Gyrodon lividus]
MTNFQYVGSPYTMRATYQSQNGAFVKAQFTPVLHAYITEQYQETQIIRGEVDVSSIWEEDLAGLEPSTTWVLTHDKATGRAIRSKTFDAPVSMFRRKDEYITLPGAFSISRDGTVEELKTRIKGYLADSAHAADISQNQRFSALFNTGGESRAKHPAPNHNHQPDFGNVNAGIHLSDLRIYHYDDYSNTWPNDHLVTGLVQTSWICRAV